MNEATRMMLAATAAKKPPAVRPLRVIAREIYADWKPVYYAAQPYLGAMGNMGGIDEPYLNETGREVVRYFLANAGKWRGVVARRIKAELKSMLEKK